MMEQKNVMPPLKPVKGLKPEECPEDHYFENGFIVFTEAYHVKRGYCCKNACRHCPYGFSKKS